MIVALADAVRATCGGKAGPLGALLRAGLPVPDGFVVTFSAYRSTARDTALPAPLADALARWLVRLGSPPVAVRSSAAGEDTAEASAAGQHESVLAVLTPDDVAHAVRACWASLHSPRAVDYRGGPGAGPVPGEPAMAVLVQRLVDAEASGVMFTPPFPGGATLIEASWGLGPSVVGGTVTPDAYRVGSGGAVVRAIGGKRTRLDRAGDGGLVEREVPAADRSRPTLDDATAVGLARLGQRVADVLGGPQDVEWALAEGRLWILQARPVTAALPVRPAHAAAAGFAVGGDRGVSCAHRSRAPGAPPASAGPGAHESAARALRGTAGSAGVATGPARVVRGPADFSRVRPGDVLVCPFTDPAWTPLLRVAAGVVTETGGVLSHAAIVARERGIPAVLGVAHATTLIVEGSTLTIDGGNGTVTVGTNPTSRDGADTCPPTPGER